MVNIEDVMKEICRKEKQNKNLQPILESIYSYLVNHPHQSPENKETWVKRTVDAHLEGE